MNKAELAKSRGYQKLLETFLLSERARKEAVIVLVKISIGKSEN